MKFDFSQFEVRLARNEDEIAAAQRLRYSVFVEEMGAKAAHADHSARLEKDPFDPYFDHLILYDTSADIADDLDRVAAVYRLLPGPTALAHGGFYSASEYDLSKLMDRADRAVELGRSCVHARHRGGPAMHLMWGALADYVLSRDISILFGVASFQGTDPTAVSLALSHLHHKHLAPEDLRVVALPEHRVEMGFEAEGTYDPKEALKQIPSLIKAYLRLGGFVGDGAYIDHDFNTIDVCLVMDTGRMVSKYHDYYKRATGRN